MYSLVSYGKCPSQLLAVSQGPPACSAKVGNQLAAFCLGPALPGWSFSIATRNTASGGAGKSGQTLFSQRNSSSSLLGAGVPLPPAEAEREEERDQGPDERLCYPFSGLQRAGETVQLVLVNMRTWIPAPM